MFFTSFTWQWYLYTYIDAYHKDMKFIIANKIEISVIKNKKLSLQINSGDI